MDPVNKEITPEEIRAIRLDLGLSQAEAGELLGGGPRAFTKYETGVVKPSAAAVTLLRLLESNPDVAAKIKGATSRPMAAAVGTSPFEVTGEHIAALNEHTLPMLLRRLLSVEALANGLPGDGIHVASNVTAPDGGEDGRIAWEGHAGHTDFLPSRRNQFQLKAGKILPARAGKDVLTKAGEVKDMVRPVLESGGHYIMFCAHCYTKQDIEIREARIRKTLRDAGMVIDDGQIQFRDADQIADWANRYPSVAVWVKEQTQPGTIGPFRSWLHWAGRNEHERSPLVEDERLPALRARLCEVAAEPHGIVRVVGPSGIGKTRLVLEALSPSKAGGSFLSDIVLYVDESEADTAAINSIVQIQADMKARALVIVDRCPPESHETLVGMVSRSSSCLSLVTIDNEIPSGTLDRTTVKLDEAMGSVIEAVINQALPGLPTEDQRRLIHFSKGFPGIAIRIAQAWAENVPIAHATDENFVESFVLGRRQQERELTLKSARLLATFRLVGLEHPADGQLDEIAAQGRNLTAADFRGGLEALVDQGVAQRRGNLVILEPKPVAIRLAESQWREWNAGKWDEILAGGTSANLKVSAARQLSLLDTTDISKDVVAHVCRPGGPFDGFGGIAGTGHASVLSFLSEIDARIVVDQIERSLGNVGDLSGVKGDTRRHLVWALEKIAFRRDTFEDGARLLLRLAVAENEQYIGNNATGQFKALFPMFLGNTAADGELRFSVLDEATDTDDPTQRSIVADALVAGVETDHFSRTVGAEIHGSRPALESWRPATKEEVVDYINGCVRRLAAFAERSDEVGLTARAELGRHLRSLVSHGFIDTVEEVIGLVGSVAGPWTEAMESLGHFLEYDASETDTEVIGRVHNLIADLQPQEWESRVRYLVTEMPWDFPCGEKVDFETRDELQADAVHGLAVEIVEQPAILEGLLPQISRGQQRMATVFGRSIAISAASPLDWLGPIIQAVMEIPEGERNFDLLSGYAAGIGDDHPDVVSDIKRQAAQSSDLAAALPLICWRVGITPSDIELAVAALHAGLLDPWRLAQWGSGRALDRVPAPAVEVLLDAMLDHSAEAFGVGMDLMGMYAHGAPGRLDKLRPQIRKSAENPSRWALSRRAPMAIHHFEKIMSWMLEKGRQDQDACATALALARALVHITKGDNEQFVKPVLPLLLSGFPEIVWPLVGQAIVSDQTRAWHFEYILGNRASPEREEEPAILSLPEDTLFAWCHAHPDEAPAFAAAILPILMPHNADSQEYLLHPTIVRLFEEFGDREDVLQTVTRNIWTFSGWGSPADYYALYQEPLKPLRDHPRGQVRRWAVRTLRSLNATTEGIRSEDAEREAQWSI